MSRQHSSSAPSIEEVILSAALSDLAAVGGRLTAPPVPPAPPAIVRHAESPWQSRVDVIARFLETDVETLLEDRERARYAAVLWQLTRA